MHVIMVLDEMQFKIDVRNLKIFFVIDKESIINIKIIQFPTKFQKIFLNYEQL